MKFYKAIILLLGFALIVSRSFFSSIVTIDAMVIIIYFLLCLPIAARYLVRAKIFGAEFQFKEKIEETREYVDKSMEVAKEKDKRIKSTLVLFCLSQAMEMLKYSPVLALASLRIEIENKLRNAYTIAYDDRDMDLTLFNIIIRLKDKGWLYQEQVEAISRIIYMCDKAMHGHKIPLSDAQNIISLADDLNHTFGVGYFPNFYANESFDEQGLLCEWEHCIELMPLHEERSNIDCPVFGHECPGGVSKVVKCGKSTKDIPINRFVKS